MDQNWCNRMNMFGQ